MDCGTEPVNWLTFNLSTFSFVKSAKTSGMVLDSSLFAVRMKMIDYIGDVYSY